MKYVLLLLLAACETPAKFDPQTGIPLNQGCYGILGLSGHRVQCRERHHFGNSYIVLEDCLSYSPLHEPYRIPRIENVTNIVEERCIQ